MYTDAAGHNLLHQHFAWGPNLVKAQCKFSHKWEITLVLRSFTGCRAALFSQVSQKTFAQFSHIAHGRNCTWKSERKPPAESADRAAPARSSADELMGRLAFRFSLLTTPSRKPKLVAGKKCENMWRQILPAFFSPPFWSRPDPPDLPWLYMLNPAASWSQQDPGVCWWCALC